MQNFSREYVSAIILIIVAICKSFGLEIPNDALEALVTGGIAIYIAVRRFKKGDITPLGAKKD